MSQDHRVSRSSLFIDSICTQETRNPKQPQPTLLSSPKSRHSSPRTHLRYNATMQAMILPGKSMSYAPCESWTNNRAVQGAIGGVMATTPVVFSLSYSGQPLPPNKTSPLPTTGARRSRSLLHNPAARLSLSANEMGSPSLGDSASPFQGRRLEEQQGGVAGAPPPSSLSSYPSRPPNTSTVVVPGMFTSGTSLPLNVYLFDLYGQLLNPNQVRRWAVTPVT